MVKVEIVLDELGRVTVSGPLDDKVFMFGLLEYAKVVVLRAKGAPTPQIVVPTLHVTPKNAREN